LLQIRNYNTNETIGNNLVTTVYWQSLSLLCNVSIGPLTTAGQLPGVWFELPNDWCMMLTALRCARLYQSPPRIINAAFNHLSSCGNSGSNFLWNTTHNQQTV